MRASRVVILALLLVAAQAFGDDFPRGPSQDILFEQDQPRHEAIRLRLVNAAGGEITASNDGGRTWRTLGHVVRPALKVNPGGYTASRWAQDSAVAATAVNGIHIKIANNPDNDKGIIFSIIPGAEAVGAATELPGASLVTDIAGGTGIFGGYGPYVNAPVYLEAGNELVALAADYVPAQSDVLQIIRREPESRPLYCTFENKFGGKISIEYEKQARRLIGQVLRPVVGIGRFEGTMYAAPGRLRANHCGVIDISTSPIGQIGGFQIVPREHAGSPEVRYIRENTQWMVVGPADVRDPSWEGVAPLFSGYLLPSYRPDDITGPHSDWMNRTLSRLMVQVRYNDGEWENMPRICLDPEVETDNGAQSERGRRGLWRIPANLKPYSPLPGSAYVALRGLTHLRIVFPRNIYWPQEPDSSLAPGE